MFSRYFYHELIRKYTIVFGSMFNNIYVERVVDGEVVQNVKVPVIYGPKQKFIAWLEAMEKATPGSTYPPKALTLPRISFEIGSISYDPVRRLPRLARFTTTGDDADQRSYMYTPAPYLINFKVAIMVKNAEDGTKIVEQILPFFSPDYTLTLNLIPDMGDRGKFDVPIILNSTNVTDTYKEGQIDQRRAIIWELDFTMKAMFFGPVKGGAKPIKDININFRVPPTDMTVDEMNPDDVPKVAMVDIRPGLTADGDPTTSLDDTIPYAEIEADDPWDFIESVYEYL